ncbi:MAG: helix-turn-helix transcriptional regulator [Chloroflexota bacterium]
MSMDAKVNLRTRKLGILIKDARLSLNKSLKECALAMGITTGVFKSYEEGRRAPSLPDLEILAYYFNLPLEHFWSNDVVSDNASPLDSLNIQALVGIRQRMIGALLRKQRMDSGISIKDLSKRSGISASRLSAYELGDTPIPVPILEELMSILEGSIESMYDQSGPIGKWLDEKKVVQAFLQLPPELQSFVCNPVNQPYLELALSLSGLSPDKLRSVAESLLEITL